MARGSLEGKRFGNYIAFDLLGQGGMGSVYLAEHPEIGRKVAIKALMRHHDDEMVQRFLDEAKAVTRIGHPNIIDIFDFGKTASGRTYYVMEWLQGKELRQVIEERGVMTAAEVQPYVEQICAAIQAAHEAGVIHRDLKPANIFVLEGEDGPTIKVLDFGVAKLTDRSLRSGLTSPGILIGTPMYAAPEQAAAESAKICPQTDIYSLGVIIYRMLAGKPPFDADNSSVLLAMHMADPPPPVRELAPSVPPVIAELVEQCLAKQPADRPASARELADRYVRAMRELTTGVAAADEAYDDGPSGVMVFVPAEPVHEVARPAHSALPDGARVELSAGAPIQATMSVPAPHYEADPTADTLVEDLPEDAAVAADFPLDGAEETPATATTDAALDVEATSRELPSHRAGPDADPAGDHAGVAPAHTRAAPEQTGPGAGRSVESTSRGTNPRPLDARGEPGAGSRSWLIWVAVLVAAAAIAVGLYLR